MNFFFTWQSVSFSTNMISLPFKRLCALRSGFQRDGAVKMERGWLTPEFCSALRNETATAVDTHSKLMQIDLNMATRHLHIVNGQNLTDRREFSSIHSIAEDNEMIEFIRFMTSNDDIEAGKCPQLTPGSRSYQLRRIQRATSWMASR